MRMDAPLRLRGGILDDPLAAAAAPQVTNMYVSFYASVVFEERARQRMREQRAAADIRRRRIRLVAFGGGLVAALASLAGVVVADYESKLEAIKEEVRKWARACARLACVRKRWRQAVSTAALQGQDNRWTPTDFGGEATGFPTHTHTTFRL